VCVSIRLNLPVDEIGCSSSVFFPKSERGVGWLTDAVLASDQN
jgi:hypothetical protein